VGDFVEFFGTGLADLSVPDRATIANMAPEYGATVGYFPIDAQTIAYLRQSGRNTVHIELVEGYARAAGLFVHDHSEVADYTQIVDIDLAAAAPSLAGPKRPQDRVLVTQIKPAFHASLSSSVATGGFDLNAGDLAKEVPIEGYDTPLRHGTILVAAITSCTNTSNPSVMIGAGLLARNAVAKGLHVPGWVKTSLAPGSKLVEDYLRRAGLMAPLERLGFDVVGFGCTTCSGKSGPIAPALAQAVPENDLIAASILSGNRNFEGRIHPACRANYLASPPLVIAFALAGRIDIDLEVEPLGMSPDGTPVYLRDIWPDAAEISTLIHESQRPEQFRQSYATLFDGGALWHSLRAPSGARFAWDAASTYVCPPPFFAAGNTPLPDAITGARVLVKVGDSLTTDHITPSGAIDPASEAGQYLIASGVAPNDFNAVTQRRGNHEFMARITFANQRMKNLLVPGIEGGFTRLSPGAVTTTIYGAAMALRAQDMPAVVLAGRDYGMGSSRDWAAKGPQLLGVRVVLAEGFERIHRSNLIGMGILPLIFAPDSNADTLGLTGFETYLFENLHGAVTAGAPAQVTATSQQGKALHFTAKVDIADDTERDLLMRGGMFAALLDRLENST